MYKKLGQSARNNVLRNGGSTRTTFFGHVEKIEHES